MTYFITLEGGEGVGKSTALQFIKSYFDEKSLPSLITREPGGTPLAEKIRDLLLTAADDTKETLLPTTEALLMFASRAQHIETVIKPALASGKNVISDRFTDASFAYQGGGRQVPARYLQFLSDWIQGDLYPTLTFLLDAPIEVGLSRIHERGAKDRIEQENSDFFNRVRHAYLERAKLFKDRFVIVDATQSKNDVKKTIYSALDHLS